MLIVKVVTRYVFIAILFCSSAVLGQSWEPIKLNEDIEMVFPSEHVAKDSLGMQIYSAMTKDGYYYVTQTLEVHPTVRSHDKWGIVELYKLYKKSCLQDCGGELVSDEVREYQKLKAAQFTISKTEGETTVNGYFLIFYDKGHLYTFTFLQNTEQQATDDQSSIFWDGISIRKNGNSSAQFAVQPSMFVYLGYLPFVLVPLTVLITVLILWKKNKGVKRSIM